MPAACQQCRNPPCVKVCPVRATWQEPDGIVVMDYNWCIGCRCCMAACPYGARHFNWGAPTIPDDELNPHMHYLGNRPRPRGVVEKCTFCIQRVRQATAATRPASRSAPSAPASSATCSTRRARSATSCENKRVFIFKEELNTNPKFYYFYAI